MASTFVLHEQLPTDLEAVNPFVERICRSIQLFADTPQDLFNVKLALEEALTNAMRHGNALDPRRHVSVRIDAGREKIVMDVHDEGAGFDFQGLPDPTTGAHREHPSGRGVFLMRSIMDDVTFYDAGSGVKMTKYFTHPT